MMKHDKRFFMIIVVCLALVITAMLWIMVQKKTGMEPDKISVIIEDSENGKWAAFKYGLKMAAQDHKVTLFIVSTGKELTEEEELALIRHEVANGADALIVQQLSGGDVNALSQMIPKSVPVMLIGAAASGENESKLLVTGEDACAVGEDLAKELLADYNGSLEGKKIGLIVSDERIAAVQERMRGFQDGIASSGAELVWSVNQKEQAEDSFALEDQEKVNIVVALDDRSLVLCGENAAANNLHGAVVYGVGHSMEAFYYLDTGVLRCLMVPDTFNAGYQSLSELAESRRHMFAKPEGHVVDHTVVRKDQLFTDEIQSILFTMSQ